MPKDVTGQTLRVVNCNQIWTSPLIRALQQFRADGLPLYLCAEKLGVNYKTAVRKAQQLGIAGRMNRGRLSGAKLVGPPVRPRSGPQTAAEG